MNYKEAERWLFGRRRMGMKYGLERMLSFLDELGNPEKDFKTVHIVGTNGKGSTAAILSSIAGHLGYSWGRGTSPHLLDYRERIVVNDNWIPKEAVAEFITDNRHAIRKHSATFFEITSAMAAWYFAAQEVNWVMAEAGLGGRLDATKTYNGEGTIFTGVRIEHSRILGDTREKIAAEKVAVAKAGSILIAYKQTEGVEEAILNVIKDKDLVRIFPKYVSQSPLPGAHQLLNSSLAYTAALSLFDKSEEEVDDALRKACNTLRWPGRLDCRAGQPDILFDVAHNPQSMQALVEFVKNKKDITIVVGFLSDKPWQKMVELLQGTGNRFITTTPDSERKLTASELAEYMDSRGFNVEAEDNIEKAVAYGRTISNGGMLVVTGSFYVVGEAINTSVANGWVSSLPNSVSDVLD